MSNDRPMDADMIPEATYRRVREVLERNQRFVLTTHRDPDGDGLGAEAALAEALGQLGKEVRVVNDGSVPPQHRFLQGSGAFAVFRAAQHRDLLARAEVVVLLDAARPERTGRLTPFLARFAGVRLAVDHHLDRGSAPAELIDARACATTELVHELLLRLPVRLTPSMAEALYCGLLADTQGFRTAHTTPEAHRRAATLLEAGASLARVHEALFASWPLGRLRLRGEFLAGLRTAANGRIVWGALDRAMLRRHRQTSAATEGLVEEALAPAGAELAILFLEEAQTVRVSLRSRGLVTVDGLARRLGGGGHAQAAGARLSGPLAPAVRRVLGEARRMPRAEPWDER